MAETRDMEPGAESDEAKTPRQARLQDLHQLRPWLATRRVTRALLLTGRSGRFTEEVVEALAGISVEVFQEAEAHVPEDVVALADDALQKTRAEAIIALGGGAAIGLGKALRLTHDLPFAAIPTTYAGSELTRIWGMSGRAGAAGRATKRTGRDERVRPDVVVHDLRFTRTAPKRLTITSLMNALAHPVSALSTETLSAADEARAERAISLLVRALRHLVHETHDDRARVTALEGAVLAGEVLDAGALGLHHRIAHRLAVLADADPAGDEDSAVHPDGMSHAALHSVLLPHFVRSLDADLAARVEKAAGVRDLPAALFDLLTRAGAATRLGELGIDGEALARVAREEDLPRFVTHALWGIRPSVHQTEHRTDHGSLFLSGAKLSQARRVVIALHGRNSNATRTTERVRQIVADDVHTAVIGPQAPSRAWFPDSYRAPPTALGPALVRALDLVDAAIALALDHVGSEQVVLLGFSQGACLAAEVFARCGHRLGGLIAFTGARLGPPTSWGETSADLLDVPVLFSTSADDPFIAAADVERTARYFSEAGARVTTLLEAGDSHDVRARERIAARSMLLEEGKPPRTLRGFGAAHESEALPGALPRQQNNPRHPPYGLYAEQVSGTGFQAPRHESRRVWLYRVRPASQHTPFLPLEHATFRADFDGAPIDPNLAAWAPLPPPDDATDFVDGICTLAGAGSPALRRGVAVHLYVANRSMEHRAFSNVDGELLLIPQEGGLVLQTELGVLGVRPGQVALLPRGLRFSVHLEGLMARGWLGEVYGRSFTLPERGPVGANGLTDPRHFEAPTAWHEDRLDPGYRLSTKIGGRLFDAHQDYTPYDVAAWHGSHVPYVYDLASFSPVGNTRFDHGDPSIFTVLSAPLDEQGAHSLDFVFFPPRWDPTEHTFRPPYFHRNATTEVNGIIYDPRLDDGVFRPGLTFLTPSLTAHGISAHSVEQTLAMSDDAADRPARRSERSLWFQLETALPLALTPWARGAPTRVSSWPHVFGQHVTRYDPRRP